MRVVRPSQAELIALLDGIATSIVWLDADGAVVHLNEPAEDMFGISRNQAAGRSMRDLLKSNGELEGVISRARAAGAQYSRREIPFEAGPGCATPRARCNGDAVRSCRDARAVSSSSLPTRRITSASRAKMRC